MHLIDIKPYEGFSHGFDTDEGYHLEKAVRIFPHKMYGEGHFVALFERTEKIIHLLKDLFQERQSCLMN